MANTVAHRIESHQMWTNQIWLQNIKKSISDFEFKSDAKQIRVIECLDGESSGDESLEDESENIDFLERNFLLAAEKLFSSLPFRFLLSGFLIAGGSLMSSGTACSLSTWKKMKQNVFLLNIIYKSLTNVPAVAQAFQQWYWKKIRL